MYAEYNANHTDLLDDPMGMQLLDPKDMMGLTMAFPDQCAEAARIGKAVEIPMPSGVNNIIISGLGGSAAGGDYIKTLMELEGTAPVVVNRDYSTPNFVGKNTLALMCSYSGNTEETLASYEDAKSRKANILCLTSGGELKNRAERDGYPCVIIPGGQPPRTALGYMFVPIFALFQKWGWLPQDNSIDLAVRFILALREDWQPHILTKDNLAKQLASNCADRIPIIYGAGYKGIIANRWKCQFNENAKTLAYANTYPELTHNEIMGWQLAGRQAGNFAVITLKDGSESTKMSTRMKVMADTMAVAIYQREVVLSIPQYPNAGGSNLLMKLLGLTYLGDFVSLYLAAIYEVDPYEINAITNLKNALAGIDE